MMGVGGIVANRKYSGQLGEREWESQVRGEGRVGTLSAREIAI